jgi:enoyl-CoA hydratase/carnithine racemase
MSNESVSDSPVLFETWPVAQGAIGRITLNRPRQLNALNLEMCELMLAQLQHWRSDDQIRAVWLEGAGEKGFCAGGDVAEVVRRVREGGEQRFEYGDRFFSTEYQLDLLIHEYPKPIISVSHGVNMGGGLGLSVGASHRLVCERSRLAMPEIHIGLFPDVGGGWFLNRVPGGVGKILALTGLVMNEADAIFAGLADCFVDSQDLVQAKSRLAALPWTSSMATNHLLVDGWMRGLARRHAAGLPESPLRMYFDALRFIAQFNEVAGIRDALLAAAKDDPWFAAPAKALAQGSPTAARVSLEYLRRTRQMSIAEVLRLDAVLAYQYPRHHDFIEGVRALLIDKDKQPRWLPALVEEVSDALVEEHFTR